MNSTVNTVLNRILGSWKSTLHGLTTSLLGICGMILAVKANPAQDPEIAALVAMLPAKWLLTIGAISGIGKLVLGAAAKDPDKVLAKLPGQTEPQQVPAHPVPDDPTAKVVIPIQPQPPSAQ